MSEDKTYDFINMSEYDLEQLSYSGNLEFKYLTEQELADLASRIPDDVFLAALNVHAMIHKMEWLNKRLYDVCKEHHISPHNALLCISAIEQSHDNERRKLVEDSEDDDFDDEEDDYIDDGRYDGKD